MTQTKEQRRLRRVAREHTPEFREAHRRYEAKRRAEVLAQWLVDHPGFTLADREFATRMRLRKERRNRFGPMVGGDGVVGGERGVFPFVAGGFEGADDGGHGVG